MSLWDDKRLDRGKAAKALLRTFARRGTEIPSEVPEGLSDTFAEDGFKRTQWAAFLRKNRLSVGGRDLRDVVGVLRGFWEELVFASKL